MARFLAGPRSFLKIANGERSVDEQSILPFTHPEGAINVPSFTHASRLIAFLRAVPT